MPEFNKCDFIDDTVNAILCAFENIEIDVACYDYEIDEWDFDKIRRKYKNKFQDIQEDVIFDRIEDQLTFLTDCWEICQQEIGGRNFSDYSDYFPNIQSLASDVLRVIIDEKYDFDEILERYLGGLEAPEKESEVGS